MNAGQILKLLRARHCEDVFVSECKNGATHSNNGLLKLDAWVMKKSWSHRLTIGYEIKVSRNDWLRDHKWLGYKRLTNKFYLVSPRLIVKEEELPADVGLLWISGSGNKLFTKRKAVYQKVEEGSQFIDLLIYVLMARATIDVPYKHDYRGKWEQFFKEKKDNQQFGAMLSRKIRKRFEDEVIKVQFENQHLKGELERLGDLCEELKKRNLWPIGYRSASSVADDLSTSLPNRLKNKVVQAKELLTDFCSEMEV